MLAAFMAGLAGGAFVGGRWTRSHTPREALFAYAGLEVVIASLAFAVPLEIRAIHPLLALTYGEGPGGPAFQGLRLLAAVLAVGVPAALMGGTYPLIVHAAGTGEREAGSLYAANTAGAALGTVATGFLFLPAVGLFRSTLIGVAGNLFVAALAWHWARRGVDNADVDPSVRRGSVRRQKTAGSPRVAHRRGAALAATAAAGALALALELAWMRTLAMVVGPTTYAFSSTVACFIVGIATGSAAAVALLRRPRVAEQPIAWLALALALAGLTTAWGMSRVDGLVLAVAERSSQPGLSYAARTAAGFARAALLVIPAAVLFGAAFPLALAAAGTPSPTDAARVYAANTVGAIAGSLLAASMAIPLLGLRGTFTAVAFAAGIAAIVVAWRGSPRPSRVTLATVAATAFTVVLALTGGWNAALLSSGAYKYSVARGEQDMEALLSAGTLHYYEEGASGTVAVRDLAGVRSLSIDGKVDASNGGDMLTQRLLAHVPLLLHPAATRVAVIGLGSGVTVGSALTYPVERVDVIEISPEVVEASAWFTRENRRALADRRVQLTIGDARTHLRLSSSRYDVVISEPSNPWMAGVAALFTREFFESLRSRLAPGGVVCQWAHAYDIRTRDLKSIVKTFASVFPDMSLWLVGDGDLLLVGSDRALPARLAETPLIREARADLEEVGVSSIRLLEHLRLGNRSTALAWAADAPLQSDDRMALEFSAPAAAVGPAREDVTASLLELAPTRQPDAQSLKGLGLMALAGRSPESAWRALLAAARALPEDRAVLDGLVRAAAASGDRSRLDAAESLLRELIVSRPEAIAARLELSKLLAARGGFPEAARVAHEAQRIAPGDADVHEQLAAIAADAGDASALAVSVDRLRTLRRSGSMTAYFEGVLRLLNDRPDEAIRFARAAVAADPARAASWNLVGSASGAVGRPDDEIRQAFARAIAADPFDPTAYINLGTLELSSGRPAVAANWFAQALTIAPDHQAARVGLASAHALR